MIYAFLFCFCFLANIAFAQIDLNSDQIATQNHLKATLSLLFASNMISEVNAKKFQDHIIKLTPEQLDELEVSTKNQLMIELHSLDRAPASSSSLTTYSSNYRESISYDNEITIKKINTTIEDSTRYDKDTN
ncbi:MAG: hypothetical protein HQK50_12770 [Oligoflexia bacterium]|nr:hypothetical protein [Oligoflexia bacterium]MBF0366437.1 hypothetical protein [Oligoflexia bacterium]